VSVLVTITSVLVTLAILGILRWVFGGLGMIVDSRDDRKERRAGQRREHPGPE
jgi:hypothetical protein